MHTPVWYKHLRLWESHHYPGKEFMVLSRRSSSPLPRGPPYMSSACPRTSCELNCRRCTLLYEAFSTHDAFKRPLCSCMCGKFVLFHCWQVAPLVTQTMKYPIAMQETQVQSLGREDPLEKGMASHSSILTCRISWAEESGGLQFAGSQRVRCDWEINTHAHTQHFCRGKVTVSQPCPTPRDPMDCTWSMELSRPEYRRG